MPNATLQRLLSAVVAFDWPTPQSPRPAGLDGLVGAAAETGLPHLRSEKKGIPRRPPPPTESEGTRGVQATDGEHGGGRRPGDGGAGRDPQALPGKSFRG